MLRVKTTALIPVRVLRNTNRGSKNDQWARIVHAKTGQVLHTGQIRYIRKVAETRYRVHTDL